MKFDGSIWNKYDLKRLILPRQFFKSVGRAKSGLAPMFGFAVAAYIAVFISFVLLVIDTSKNYINEVTIMSTDLTGSDGYTCEMISKVTNTYTTRSSTDPTTSYYLVNIIESKSQCQNDLAAADPCNTPQTYIPGQSSPPRFAAGTYFTAVGMYGNDLVYELDSYGYFLIYNYFNGSVHYSSSPVVDVDINFFGVDTFGNVNYLQKEGMTGCTAATCVLRITPYFQARVLWEYTTTYNGIINDNMYNLYLYDNTTMYAVDYTSAVPTQTLLLQLNTVPLLPLGSSFLSVAVYIDEPTNVRTIYFGSKNATSGSTSFYMHRDGITTKLVTPIDAVTTTPLVTNGIYLFCPCTLENRKYSAICGFSLFDSNNKGYIDESFQPIAALTYQSIGISSNSTNNRMFITASSDQTHTTNQYFFYQNGFYMEGLANQYNFAAGWFTCGDEIIAPVSALTTTYTSECSSNGIVGEVLYQEQNRYLFTPTDAATYAIRNSAPYCPAIYEQACNVVADLPPYSCTKRKYPTVFTVLGTAFANCMALLSLIIFVSSIILTYLSKYYPSPDDERSMSRMDNFSTNAENDVELGAVSSTVNPISGSK